MIQTRVLLGTVILFTSIILTGCGNDNPEDVAIKMVEAKASGDIKTLNQIGLDEKSKIKNLIKRCKKDEINRFSEEIKSEELKWKKKAKSDEYKEIMKPFEDELKIKMQKFDARARVLQRQYDIFALEKLKSQAQLEIIQFTKKVIKSVDNSISDDMADAISMVAAGKSYRNAAISVLTNRNYDEVDAECSQSFYGLKAIDDITVIEVTGEKKDEKRIRLELIFKDGSSKKQRYDAELIQGKWKIS
jgi:hypothetical protein